MIDPTMGVPTIGLALASAFASASPCGFCSGWSGTLGVEVTPHTSSLLKKVRPADVPETRVSSSNAFARPPPITDHFVGWLGSAAIGLRSQLAESVIGGRLQFMLPLRSTKNSRLEGRRWLSNAAVAHDSRVMAGVLDTKISAPPAPRGSPLEPPGLLPPDAAPEAPAAPSAIALGFPPAPLDTHPAGAPLLGEHAVANRDAATQHTA